MSTRGMRHSTTHAHDQPAMIMHHPQHLYPSNAGPGGYGSPQQYGQLFPLGGPGPGGPMNMGPPGSIPPPPPRFEPQYDPALYQHQYPSNMIRQTSVPGSGNRNDGGNVSEHREDQALNGGQRERGGGEMFAAFLEADERSRQMAAAAAQRQHQDQLNWPSSNLSPSTPSAPSNQPGASGNAPGAPTNTGNWFDLFGSGHPTTNPAPGGGTSVPWPNITADLVRILDANTSKDNTSQQPEGSVPPAACDHPPGSTSKSNDGDSAKTTVENVARPAQSRQEAADEAEAEKDAEGEDEDVDSGGGDKKAVSTTSATPMVVDPPQSSTQADDCNRGEIKEENGGDDVGHEGEDDGAANATAKPARGRPKKATGGSRGKGKAKG